MDFLTVFATTADYEEARQNLVLPNVSLCEDDMSKVYYNPYDFSQAYFTTVALGDGEITFSGRLATNKLSYSKDGGENWTEMSAQTQSVSVSQGDKVLWKGTPTPARSGIGSFTSTSSCNVEGNAMSLLYGDNFVGQTDLSGKDYALTSLFDGNTQVASAENLSLPATTLSEHCYSYMFYGCTSLTAAPLLPATTLAEHCYENMFECCTSLTTTPELPATTLADYCYTYMFDGCTSLITATQLPATILTEGCYDSMFFDCSSLTTAPQLSATTLANSCCISMFAGCTSLTTAPELPAITLDISCYDTMFAGCTSLTSAPELPATTLAEGCYCNMFHGCTNLTKAPQLPATTLTERCYHAMFSGCTSLNSITCLATDISAEDCTLNWVSSVASSGTFYKNFGMNDWQSGTIGIPSGWEVENANAPLLMMWVDDFWKDEDGKIYGDPVEEVMRTAVEDEIWHNGANPYYYYGDTIEHDGEEYFLWVWTDESIDWYQEIVHYFVTKTVDFNTLYHESLEDNLENHFTSAVGFFSIDKEEYNPQIIGGCKGNTDCISLVKIERINEN